MTEGYLTINWKESLKNFNLSSAELVLLGISMKNLYFKYVLLGLWLICYVPFKKAFVLSSQSAAVAVHIHNQECTLPVSTSDQFTMEWISPSLIQSAYQHKLHLPEYSDSPMIYLDSWNPRISNINLTNWSARLTRSYLNSTYLLRLSGHKIQDLRLPGFSPS